MPKKPKELNRPEAGYEKRDLNTGVIVGFAGIVFAMTLGAILITYPIVRGFQTQREPMTSGKERPSAELIPSQVVRGPALEDMPKAERRAIELPSDVQLHSYGELADVPGRVHIPIEEAIGLLAAGEAPYKAAAPNSPSLTPAPSQPAEPSGDTGAR
jgi:hypothetical protein